MAGGVLRGEVRRLLQSPWFFVGSALTMAVGVGLNTALLEASFQVLRDPLGVAEPERLFRVSVTTNPSEPTQGLPLMREDFETLDQVLEEGGRHSVAASTPAGWLNLRMAQDDAEGARLVAGFYVSDDYFDVIGAPLAAGTFENDVSTSRRVVLSEPLARSLALPVGETAPEDSGSAASSVREHPMLGRNLLLNQELVTVVGVAGPGFKGLSATDNPIAVWMPLQARGIVEKTVYFESAVTDALPSQLTPWIRLHQGKAGSLLAQLETVGPELHSLRPASNGLPRSLKAESVSEIQPLSHRQLQAIPFLFGVGAIVLLIAGSNVASLFLLRGEGRRQELAIRRSLGARTRHLVFSQLREAGFVALVGAGVGAPIAAVLLQALWHLRSPRLAAEVLDLGLNGRVITIALGLSLFSAWFAAAPALRLAVSPNLRARISHSASCTGRLVLGTQVAFAVILLVAAALTFQSLRAALEQPLGFDPERVAVFTYEFGSGGDEEQETRELVGRMLAALRAHPMVESASTSTMHFGNMMASVLPLEDGEPPLFAAFNTVSEGYFETLDVGLLAGRWLDENDRAGSSPVVVVNTTFAQKAWPGKPAVGETFDVLGRVVQVVGVVEDTKVFSATERAPTPHFYVPFRQHYISKLMFNVRLREQSPAALAAVSAALRLEAPHQAFQSTWWSTWVEGSTWATRVASGLTTVAGLLGLALVAAGLFASLSTWVARTLPEFGTRAALGATPRALRRAVVGRAMLPVVAGLALGTGIAALGASRAQTLLFEVSALEPRAYLAAGLLLLSTASAAVLAPARKAGAADPARLLRQE